MKVHTAVTAAAVAWALVLLAASCSTKKEIPADPAVVEAFKNVDATLVEIASASDSDWGMKDRANAAIVELSEKLGSQQSKYSNPQQGADLHKLVIELGHFSGRAFNIGDNPDADSRAALLDEWIAIRPKLKPYVGGAYTEEPAAAQ